jgi:hypothetical protein
MNQIKNIKPLFHRNECLRVHKREMHRGWGNTDGVGEISSRFSTG